MTTQISTTFIIAALMIENAKLRNETYTDPLTKVGNRRKFDKHLLTTTQLAQQEEQSVAVIIIDIDYFKQINTEIGHPKADEVLCQITNIIVNSVRGEDAVYRHGGEEFAVILPSTNLEDAIAVAERVRLAVQSAFSEQGYTISAGVAAGIPKADGDRLSLMEYAYLNLRSAKAEGRNKVFW